MAYHSSSFSSAGIFDFLTDGATPGRRDGSCQQAGHENRNDDSYHDGDDLVVHVGQAGIPASRHRRTKQGKCEECYKREESMK